MLQCSYSGLLQLKQKGNLLAHITEKSRGRMGSCWVWFEFMMISGIDFRSQWLICPALPPSHVSLILSWLSQVAKKKRKKVCNSSSIHIWTAYHPEKEKNSFVDTEVLCFALIGYWNKNWFKGRYEWFYSFRRLGSFLELGVGVVIPPKLHEWVVEWKLGNHLYPLHSENSVEHDLTQGEWVLWGDLDSVYRMGGAENTNQWKRNS